MRQSAATFLFVSLFLSQVILLNGQQKIFNRIQIPGLEAAYSAGITSIAQDHQGNMWLIAKNKGLYKYDGLQALPYIHDPKDINSITGAPLETITIDADDNIWIGTLGGGMDKYDHVKNTFFHFRHAANNPNSLANDTVTAILQDHLGMLWIGTSAGLDNYNSDNGKFLHYPYKPNDPNSLSGNHVRVIYEDKQGTVWVGCGSPFSGEESWLNEGGLNRLNRSTGKFTRFLHDPANPNSIASNKVRAILEDSKGNLWVGTAGDGLHTLNRSTGIFTHYYYDSLHPQKLSRPRLSEENAFDHITFIKEDAKGKLWIGTFYEGINEYDPQSKKLTHHGFLQTSDRILVADTLTGFTDFQAWSAFSSSDGILWITTLNGNIFNVDPFDKAVIPYTDLPKFNINTIYKDNSGTLWICTIQGLIRKEATGKEKILLHDPKNINSPGNNFVNSIVADDNNKFWLATIGGGLDKFDQAANNFTHYKHEPDNPKSISSDTVGFLYIDENKYLWVTTSLGVDKMNTKTGEFVHYSHDEKDENSLSTKVVVISAEDKLNLWAESEAGVNKINKSTGKVKRYLTNIFVRSVCIDAAGEVWAGTADGLYQYDKASDKFLLFDKAVVNAGIILNIIEDDKRNLWITTPNAFFKLNQERRMAKMFGPQNGVRPNVYDLVNNYKTKEGEFLFVGSSGYYDFFPENVADDSYAPRINITGLQIKGREIMPASGDILNKPIYNTEEINLAYNQSSFSITFSAIHFRTPGEERYLYMLENYDNKWHEAGADRKAYFYGLNKGHYIFRIKAINPDGTWSEKKLAINITPPWWQTWWAITLGGLAFVGLVWGFFSYRSKRLRIENRLLETKVAQRTAQLEQSIHNLKAAQSQLIQSEKMASLGELTAGIAHEIQNPLNFVNNFSEVNKELIAEMRQEIDKGNIEEIKAIASDIEENEEKIIHHGKRADAIVKGMLQHSRSSTQQKEQTDINALADEYLRLSYHGLRAKDKTFNATMQTDFDNNIGLINIIPQDIGRVLLNLYNNAFYAVMEKKKDRLYLKEGEEYVPTVIVSTKSIKSLSGNPTVIISVKDNGNGIPQNVVDKIFQPFFTTKPTGQGTGLGLSLSYDIIKAHGGEIKVETKEGEGSTFIITL